jgi:hypothetical protein
LERLLPLVLGTFDSPKRRQKATSKTFAPLDRLRAMIFLTIATGVMLSKEVIRVPTTTPTFRFASALVEVAFSISPTILQFSGSVQSLF